MMASPSDEGSPLSTKSDAVVYPKPSHIKPFETAKYANNRPGKPSDQDIDIARTTVKDIQPSHPQDARSDKQQSTTREYNDMSWESSSISSSGSTIIMDDDEFWNAISSAPTQHGRASSDSPIGRMGGRLGGQFSNHADSVLSPRKRIAGGLMATLHLNRCSYFREVSLAIKEKTISDFPGRERSRCRHCTSVEVCERWQTGLWKLIHKAPAQRAKAVKLRRPLFSNGRPAAGGL